MKLNLLSIILSISLIFSGCASKVNFAHTPVKQEDFTKSKVVLEQEYSDIDEYTRMLATPSNRPKMQELEGLWGKATVETKWTGYIFSTTIVVAGAVIVTPLLLLLLAINPKPVHSYTWDKGNYTIKASETSDALSGYESRMHSWKWEENNSSLVK